jgi:hypothetical protein
MHTVGDNFFIIDHNHWHRLCLSVVLNWPALQSLFSALFTHQLCYLRVIALVFLLEYVPIEICVTSAIWYQLFPTGKNRDSPNALDQNKVLP